MKTLTLMRHAKSSWDDPGLADHDRPLNGRGTKAAATMASRLKAEGYVPDLVVVSTSRRTRETVEPIQKAYGGALALRFESKLYEASPAAYAEIIRATEASVEHLMLIGHNPTLEILAERLGAQAYRMPTAAYIRFLFDGPWASFDFRPCEVAAYDYPKSRK